VQLQGFSKGVSIARLNAGRVHATSKLSANQPEGHAMETLPGSLLSLLDARVRSGQTLALKLFLFLGPILGKY
jgi:hypothetical protein